MMHVHSFTYLNTKEFKIADGEARTIDSLCKAVKTWVLIYACPVLYLPPGSARPVVCALSYVPTRPPCGPAGTGFTPGPAGTEGTRLN